MCGDVFHALDSIMRIISRGLIALLLALALLAMGRLFGVPSLPAKESVAFAALPLLFERNAGQAAAPARYLARSSGVTLYFAPSGVSFGGAARVRFMGANRSPVIEGGEPLPGKTNYLKGSDPRRWLTNVPTYAEVTYSELYTGVRLTYSGAGGHLKGTYTVAPAADPANIRWRYEAIKSASVDKAGNLQITLLSSSFLPHPSFLTEHAPVAWQEIDGKRVDVAVRYVVEAEGTVRFELGRYDPSQALVIDPTITYGSYLGGSGEDAARDVAVDAAGNIYVVGHTDSVDFPTQGAYQPGNAGGFDAFITKLDPTGSSLLYSTYIGGDNDDRARGVAVSAGGSVYVSGSTNSLDFPLVNAIQSTFGGGDADAFALVLNPSGSALAYSTYLGGAEEDRGYDTSVDLAGNAYLTGPTWSTNFPTHNPMQSYCGGTTYPDGFVAKFAASGPGLVYSTYLCGGDDDRGIAIAADAAGNAYVAGHTNSEDFPIRNAYQPQYRGYQDAFVAKLDPQGAGLVYSTYLGGTVDEAAWAIVLDAQGSAYVSGFTRSPDFPLVNPLQPRAGGDDDAWLARLTPAGSGLVFSTFLGGNGHDFGQAVAVDAQGSVAIAGRTGSTDFPTRNPVQAQRLGSSDAFLARLDGTGLTLYYSTYLGGSHLDDGWGVALDGAGSALVVGSSLSGDFPQVDPYQGKNAGGWDGFVARVASEPQGTVTPCPPDFTDVPQGNDFYAYIRYLACRGVVSGYADGTFRPQNPTTRAQVCKIIVLAEGWQLYTPLSPSFIDVPASDPFYAYVETAYYNGIVSGYSNGEFRPGNNVTRGQLAKMVVLAEAWSLIRPPLPSFDDVPADHPFFAYVETAYNHAIISGYADRTFRPGNNATRGQVSKVVLNAVDSP
jgi:hypothetical protein